ncbi:MAG TPA: hypothetical protein VKP69_20220 [Isosphaeraceae bacterium]|nr:hypothetical protein [Isosphaeraceae bacterium]
MGGEAAGLDSHGPPPERTCVLKWVLPIEITRAPRPGDPDQ